ncbi:hypothetical protein [Paenibacillus popilliae]|uniref:Efflux RND transporter periplasmic adaptor subunit n=1 Tax=Paenibacillus popilliae TaxID=78057 RepID=A0ABY3AN20_PAEPP|nr:hypothetical protein [Paenibacillus sp. SDF0028]TQR43952.1 hypothetical protein C7Y44_17725 [Paenibacillus sp. SDF0028]
MKKWVYVAGILLVAGAATAVYLTQRPAEQPSAANLPTRTVQASKGNMETKVSGSGSVSEAASLKPVEALRHD